MRYTASDSNSKCPQVTVTEVVQQLTKNVFSTKPEHSEIRLGLSIALDVTKWSVWGFSTSFSFFLLD